MVFLLQVKARKSSSRLIDAIHLILVKGNNEVALFDCESGSRQKTLWASKAPALSTQRADNNSTPDSVLGMVLLNTHSTSGLLTAGSDMRVRFWDFKNSASSVMLSDGLRPHHNGFALSQQSHSDTFAYSSKFVDGIEVFILIYGAFELTVLLSRYSWKMSVEIVKEAQISLTASNFKPCPRHTKILLVTWYGSRTLDF